MLSVKIRKKAHPEYPRPARQVSEAEKLYWAHIAPRKHTRFSPEPQVSSSEEPTKTCFVATEIYGPSARELVILKCWRDSYLAQKCIGKLFITLYYKLGPVIARYISTNVSSKRLIKKLIDGLVKVIDSISLRG